MSYRKRTRKPTVALWMLVAVADLALVLASAGVMVLTALVSAAAVAGVGVAAWRSTHQRPVPVRVPARRG